MWGYDRTPVLPDELEPGQHDLHYSDPSKPKRQKGSKLGDEGDSSFGSDSESGEKGASPNHPRQEARVDGNTKQEFKIIAGSRSRSSVGLEWILNRFKLPMKESIQWDRTSKVLVDWNMHSVERGCGTTLVIGMKRRIALRLQQHSSVGSGEMKYKAEFEAVDLDAPTCTDGRYTSLSRDIAEEDIDDPFLTKQPSLGWRKPLSPQPKESPFRPAILNFGLRSRSKTYDAVSPAPQDDTPVKASRFYTTSNAQNETSAGFFGLGISRVWKAVTDFTSSQPHQQMADEEDEESFVARPYRPYSEVMSENDTPYSTRRQPYDYIESGTPIKAQSLNRTGTVLNVKSTNQPWSTSERKMTTADFKEALLASPANKEVQHRFQPLVQQSASPTKQKQAAQSLAPRKSLLLQRAIAANNGGVREGNGDSTAFRDYSDLVACYSTPSDAVFSPETFGVDDGEEEVVASIRALPQAASEGSAWARANKLRPLQIRGAGGGVQRSKTASTASSASAEPASRLGPGLGGKGTMYHSVLKKQPCARQQPEQTSPPSAAKNMYPYTSTQPLRLNKSEMAIPQRGSSSATKPQSSFPTGTVLPSSLRIASREPLTKPYNQHQGFPPFPHPHHPHYRSATSASPPKRTKAVSNRSNRDENKADMEARTVMQKAKNHSTALKTVDHIVWQSYAQHHQHYSS
ncbi:hypothetical protein NDA17_005827 [Ustilago hordei]|nr:hypothetical protein NDA17_005827 [Ustilago hordei]